jgi:hypothetical protein
MNALENIKDKAEIIVNDLADREIARMKDNYNEFDTWLAIEGNPIMDSYNNSKINAYESINKYLYITQCGKWNSELKQYVYPTTYTGKYRCITQCGELKQSVHPITYTGSFEERKQLRSREIQTLAYELQTMLRNNWEDSYRKEFVNINMAKLNRALAKHLTNDMTASDIKVNVGGDGAEVTAIVDDKLFKTFGTLCGGYVQVLHYRYRSSLK